MKTPTRWLSAAAAATALATTAGLVAAAPAAQAAEVQTAYGLVTTPLGTSAIVTFATTQPGSVSAQMPVAGLALQEQVLAIDVRPSTGVLYGITSTSRLVTLTLQGPAFQAAAVGTVSPAVAGTTIGFDFNPVVDRIRLVSPSQNLRINPVDVSVTVDTAPATTGTGAAGAVGGAAYTRSFASSTSTLLFDIDHVNNQLVRQEPNSGVLTAVGPLGVDVTEINGFDTTPADDTAFAALQPTGATRSTLYKVNLSNGSATTVGSFPEGTVLRGLSLATPGVLGFADGPADGSAYRVGEAGNGLEVTVVRTGGSEGSVSVRYATSDGTAKAGQDFVTTSGILTFGPGESIKRFTVPITADQAVEGRETFGLTLSQPTGGAGLLGTPGAPATQPATPSSTKTVQINDSQSGTLFGVTTTNQLATFTINAPEAATVRPIGGLAAGEQINGIDLRPSNGRLYATTNQSRLLTVDTASATASPVGTITPPLNGNLFGVDVNPVADRLRVTSDNDQNLRVNADTPSSSVADEPLKYATGNPSISAVAYDNNIRGAKDSTTIFGLDNELDVLVSSETPNAGAYQTVGATGVDFTGINGFDISGQGGLALAALIPGGATTSSLYRVDLATGRSTVISPITTAATPLAPSTGLTLTGLTFGDVGTASATQPPPKKPEPKGDTAVGRVTLDIGARGNTITAGNRPLLSGIVSDTSAQPRGLAGKTVTILQKVYNTRTYAVLTTATTDANGRYELRVNPDRQRAYVARVTGPNGVKQSDQDGQRADVIFVNNRVNVSAPVGGARTGRTTTVRGDLDPDFASIPVGVALLRNGRFTFQTQGVTDSQGRFTIGVRNLPVGDYALVVYTSARQGTNAGAASRAVTVR